MKKLDRRDVFALVRVLCYLAVFAMLALIPLSALGGPTPCLFTRAFGRECPGCGGTRAFVMMARLQFGQAFRLNPVAAGLFFPALVLFSVNDLACFLMRIFGKREIESFFEYLFLGTFVRGLKTGVRK